MKNITYLKAARVRCIHKMNMHEDCKVGSAFTLKIASSSFSEHKDD